MREYKWGLILNVIFSSFQALASVDSSNAKLITDDFCNYPYEAICNAQEFTDEKQKERIINFKEDLKRGKVRIVTEEMINPGYLTRLARSEYHLEKEALRHVATIQMYLKESIEASSLPFDITLKMEQTIANAPIITLQRMKKHWLHPTAKDVMGLIALPLRVIESTRSFLSICGVDGLNVNAFVTEDILIICPGWLVASFGDSPEENFETILQALGHEMGHLLYWDQSLKSVYSTYQACLEKYPTNGLDRSVSADMNEIVADYWGTEVIVNYFINKHLVQAYGHGLSDLEKLNVLRRSFSNLCDSTAGTGHPDGRYRIETLLRRNPDINAVMGCLQTLKEASFGCNLAGEQIL